MENTYISSSKIIIDESNNTNFAVKRKIEKYISTLDKYNLKTCIVNADLNKLLGYCETISYNCKWIIK